MGIPKALKLKNVQQAHHLRYLTSPGRIRIFKYQYKPQNALFTLINISINNLIQNIILYWKFSYIQKHKPYCKGTITLYQAQFKKVSKLEYILNYDLSRITLVT